MTGKTSPEALLESYRDSLVLALSKVSLQAVKSIGDLLRDARIKGAQVFIVGNGGSAATATHMLCDLSKSTILENVPRLRVVPVVDSVPLITAWANDTGYENIFAEQIESHVRPGDVVIALSGSGESENILLAVRRAREHGATTVGLTGFAGGQLKEMVDICVVVDSDNMGQIEDVHHAIGHMLASVLSQPQ